MLWQLRKLYNHREASKQNICSCFNVSCLCHLQTLAPTLCRQKWLVSLLGMHSEFSLTYLASNSERACFFLFFFFFFFKQWVTEACLLGQLKTRPRDLTAVLSIVTFRVVKTSDFLGLTGLSPGPSSLLTNFSFTLGQQPGPGFGD